MLIHGLSGNSRWWSSVIDRIPQETGVIALDIRGRAGSADAPSPFDLTTVAEDVVRCLDHFGVDRAIIAGYSMGGWVAALVGVNHPTRVDRIVLVDGGLPIPRDPDTDPEELIEGIVGASLRRLEMEFADEDSYYELWKSHPAFGRHWNDSMKPALGHELTRDGDVLRVRANREAIEVGARELAIGPDANAAAEKLAVPTHLIVVERGTMDQPGGMIPLQTAENAAIANPELTMQYLPGINHYTLVLGVGAGPVASAIVGAT